MRWEVLLPTRVRMLGRRLEVNRQGLLATLRTPKRPAVNVAHDVSELQQLRDAAREHARAVRAAAAGLEPATLASLKALRVVSVRHQTKDTVTLTLEGEAQPYHPGQYLTLALELEGVIERRCYSLTSDPAVDRHFSITVKRIPGGRVSSYLCDVVREGDVLRCLSPAGGFWLEPELEASRRIVMVSGGVGLTPLLSVARAVLRREPKSTVTLLTVDHHPDRRLFVEELQTLQKAYHRFRVIPITTEGAPSFKGRVGRLEGPLLEELVKPDPESLYLLCGPESLMHAVSTHLRDGGVPSSQIRQERFVPRPRGRGKSSELVTVHFARRGVLLQVSSQTTLLEAALSAGIPLKFSCTLGGCGTCRLKLTQGEVEMEEPHCLSLEELAAGECLACIARPLSPLEINA